MKPIRWIGLGAILLLTGCGDSSSPATQPTAQQKLRDAGENIREAATIAATQAAEAAREAGQNIKEGAAVASTQAAGVAREAGTAVKQGIHEAAEKVADWTASAPATRP